MALVSAERSLRLHGVYCLIHHRLLSKCSVALVMARRAKHVSARVGWNVRLVRRNQTQGMHISREHLAEEHCTHSSCCTTMHHPR